MVSIATIASAQRSKPVFRWASLPPLPDAHGFAGCYAGVSNGALLVAGGANFPDGGAPWTGSAKVWHDSIFVLSAPDGTWQAAGRLPRPLGYGISISWKNKLICLGGSHATGHSAKAWVLTYTHGTIEISQLPDLPAPLANACGALIGNTVYVAGGIATPDAPAAGTNFWRLNLASPQSVWEVLPTWPGPGRMLAVAGVQQGCFYLLSGVALVNGARRYLTDAYCYHPQTGWRQIASLPDAVAAAPSPAYNGIPHRLLVLGGDDGQLSSQAATLRQNHPGFSNTILCYDTQHNRWMTAGRMQTDKKPDAASNPNASTWAPVTVPAVLWKQQLVLPGGEVRPATRTPRVLVATAIR